MYIHVTPRGTAAAQATRCAEDLEASRDDARRLLDAICSAHTALMGAMVEALSGAAGVGAFADELAGKHLEFLGGQRDTRPNERTLDFTALFQRMQERGRLDFSDPLHFTCEEKQAASDIDKFRQLIDHPKPTLWGVHQMDLLRALASFPSILQKCVGAADHRYLTGDLNLEIESALARLRRALARPALN